MMMRTHHLYLSLRTLRRRSRQETVEPRTTEGRKETQMRQEMKLKKETQSRQEMQSRKETQLRQERQSRREEMAMEGKLSLRVIGQKRVWTSHPFLIFHLSSFSTHPGHLFLGKG